MFDRLKFLLTGVEDSTDVTTGETWSTQFDWADRLALGGFHADRWHWLRRLGPVSYCPRRVNRGTYGGRCRCESCLTRDGQWST